MIPTEEVEQMHLVMYCRSKGYKFFRVPNETYTKSWSQKRKNKELGVVRGVPDLFIVAHGRLMAVEMKRVKGSVTSPEQKEWVETLNSVGVPSKICKGAEEAIEFIESNNPVTVGGQQWQEQF